MQYSPYGVEAFRSVTESRRRPRAETKAADARTEDQPHEPDARLGLPQGITEKEAAFFLGIFARLKERRFGRVEVTVREGSVSDIEFVEKVDRNLLRVFSS